VYAAAAVGALLAAAAALGGAQLLAAAPPALEMPQNDTDVRPLLQAAAGKLQEFQAKFQRVDADLAEFRPFMDRLHTAEARLDAVAARLEAVASQDALAEVRDSVAALDARMAAHERDVQATLQGWKGRPMVTQDDIRTTVRGELETFAADRTGRPDWALHRAGGRVTAHSELWARPRDLYSQAQRVGHRVAAAVEGAQISDRLPAGWAGWADGLLGRLPPAVTVHPKASAWLLEPPAHGGAEVPGDCLALKGGTGFVEVKLRGPVAVDAVTLEHIPKAISYNIATAPRRFRLGGWTEGSDAAPVDFGEHEYTLESALQTFSLPHVPLSYRLVDTVRFELVSNWGYEAYTCLYRLRVHGSPPRPGPPGAAAAARALEGP